MGASTLFGILATGASLTMTFVALPAQIWKNYDKGNCEGLSPAIIVTAVATYSMWTAYAWTKPDLFLQIAQTPGCILSLILLFQLFHYRGQSKGPP
jgi:uncharacterized protein with PQ loop repeat